MSEIYVLGADEDGLELLRRLPDPSWHFHPLLESDELIGVAELDLHAQLDRARRLLDDADPAPDAVIGYWDFPVTSMVPILCRERGLVSASLESVLRCEHKYWSRVEQAEVIDDLPAFGVINLDRDDPADAALPAGVGYPVWVKPVKSASSALAFRVTDDGELRSALAEIADGIGAMGLPFEDVLAAAELPQEIADLGAKTVLVEEEVTGHQATVEGYEHDGEVHLLGIIDSLTFPGSPSFRAYRYPSGLPDHVLRRFADDTTRVIERVGLTSTTFNVEFFWDEESDRITLLEINPRHSQSHAWLFERVDGVPNHEAVVALALGQRPSLPRDGGGEYAVAAKCQVRHFHDGIVRRLPDDEALRRIEDEIGPVHLRLVVAEGDRLSEQPLQDSYSYELAQVFVAADDEEELVATYRRCVEALDIGVEDVEPAQ